MEKNLEIREGRQEQWKPTCTPCNFYFLAQELSSEHEERFPTIFFYIPVRISIIMNAHT